MKNKNKLELIEFFNLSQEWLETNKENPSESYINKYRVLDGSLDELKVWASSIFNYKQLEDLLIYCVNKNNPKERISSFPQFFIDTLGKKNFERNFSLYIASSYEASVQIIWKFNIFDQLKDTEDTYEGLSPFSFLSSMNELEVDLENKYYKNSWFFITNENHHEISDIKQHLKLLIIDLLYTQLRPDIEKVIEYIGALTFQIPTFSKNHRLWTTRDSNYKNKIDKWLRNFNKNSERERISWLCYLVLRTVRKNKLKINRQKLLEVLNIERNKYENVKPFANLQTMYSRHTEHNYTFELKKRYEVDDVLIKYNIEKDDIFKILNPIVNGQVYKIK